MRDHLRQHFRFYLLAFLAAVALRLLFLFSGPRITDDSLVYGDIAQNWLRHGIYGLTINGVIVPTYIRLPGYPAFLAAVFAIFGAGHYQAVFILQMLADLGSCLLIADMARRLVSPRAAKAAFLLAALCPFLANYAAAALTETLEVFFTALALDLALLGIASVPAGKLLPWFGCGLAIACAILLRPDGGLILAAIGPYLAWHWLRAGKGQSKFTRAQCIRAGLVVAVAALAPLVPWTFRNLRTMHRFQPLAPRYANDPGESPSSGFNRWVGTWIADYVSVEEIYWSVSGSPLEIDKLPARAFDSEKQRQETAQLAADYNQILHVTPALDARFAALAAERVHDSRLRYYAWLPTLRIADMWLRPRTELLPADTRWWEFDDDPKGFALAISLGVIGLLYPAFALAGWWKGRFSAGIGALLLFLILRSAFLGSLENPEPRYTLEGYPVIVVLASAVWATTKPKYSKNCSLHP